MTFLHDVKKRDANKPFSCPRDGYFPDPDTCTRYYMCNGGTPTAYDCGEGLVWDPDLNLCGWASSVECRNGNRPWEKITDINGGRISYDNFRGLINAFYHATIKALNRIL